jgi:hypothetical protein
MALNLDQLQDRIIEGIRKASPPAGYEHLGECWEWTGRATGKMGYGTIRLAGSPTEAVHRVSLWAFTGRMLQDDELVLHQCDNGRCVRPTHFKIGTHVENMAERSMRGRQCCGSSHYKTNLTDEDIQGIRLHRSWGWTHTAIADQFNTTKSAVEHILAGRTFAHVPYDPRYDGNFIPF